ncbi:MAG: hypothetical protein JKY02_00135 [Flavobacteriaceae bacterium]|nr:hypothetical protein [Flavobacteriaceae bacterium]
MKIDVTEVASFFPNYTKIDEIDLDGNQKSFTRFPNENKYVLYSNVYNLTDQEYDLLEKNYVEIKRFERFNIYVSIYKARGLSN